MATRYGLLSVFVILIITTRFCIYSTSMLTSMLAVLYAPKRGRQINRCGPSSSFPHAVSAGDPLSRWNDFVPNATISSREWHSSSNGGITVGVATNFVVIHHVSKKTLQNCFCQNFVKFPPILIIFGRKTAKRLRLPKTAKRLRLCEVHSFSTSPNSHHHTTVLNANVPNCYITL